MTKNINFFGRIYSPELEKLNQLPKSCIMVFLHIKIKAGAKNSFFLFQRDISRELNISFSTVQKALYRLKENGLINILQRGGKRANIYSFPILDTHITDLDTHTTVSIKTDLDTHTTMSIPRLEEKEKDNNYNLIKLIDKISFLWNWNIDASQYDEICAQYPNINHDIELMTIDGWLRKKERTWSGGYALKGIKSWFDRIKQPRNKIPKAYQQCIHPSLIPQSIASQPSEETKEEQERIALLIEQIEKKDKAQKEEQKRISTFIQKKEQEEQKERHEEAEIIGVSTELHHKQILEASPELQEIIRLLQIEKGVLLTSYRLKTRKYTDIIINERDRAYILDRIEFEGFYALASLFDLRRECG